MDYYYTDHNRQAQGPLPLSQIQAMAAAGVLPPDALVAKVGAQSWVALATLSAGENSQTPSSIPVLQPEYEPLAIWSILLSFLGVFACCCGFFGAIPGIVTGFKALASCKANPGLKGKELALAGVVLGFIGVIFNLILIGFVIVMGMNRHAMMH